MLGNLVIGGLFFSLTTAFVPPCGTNPPISSRSHSSTNLVLAAKDDETAIKNSEQSFQQLPDAPEETPTLQDLDDVLGETMWKMKILREEKEFMDTRPSSLQNLFETCRRSVRVGTSTIPGAGKGLFASQFIQAGTILTFYPVHALGVNFADGSSFVQSQEDHDHSITSAYALSLVGNRPIWGIDLEEHFDGMGFVDADPGRPVVDSAWLCHFINDGATITRNSPESVLDYYKTSLENQNAAFLPFGPSPVVVAVATRDISEGSEIFTCYGRLYWLGTLEPDEDFWSPRTNDILAVERNNAHLLNEASDKLELKHANEAMDLHQAFRDIA